MRVRSRRRFIRRVVALGWFASLMFGGLYLSTAWWPELVRRASQTVDPQTLSQVAHGVVIGVAAAAALLMTRWSWAQLRQGGLARLYSYVRRRDN